ncbi:unnamed protein product [Pleuronectes platessa]|uniref:Uncharacterized protein n=1 Tax=Pleuronectes platessa TaxID=8262 RepID=A0A9N7U961_PLEPL|nr:unnamed protein product [Pleuronectes platessa]
MDDGRPGGRVPGGVIGDQTGPAPSPAFHTAPKEEVSVAPISHAAQEVTARGAPIPRPSTAPEKPAGHQFTPSRSADACGGCSSSGSCLQAPCSGMQTEGRFHHTETPVSPWLGLSQAGFGPPSSPQNADAFVKLFSAWSSFLPHSAFPSRPRAGRGTPPRRKCTRRGPASAGERSREDILPNLQGSPDARRQRGDKMQGPDGRRPFP